MWIQRFKMKGKAEFNLQSFGGFFRIKTFICNFIRIMAKLVREKPHQGEKQKGQKP